VSSGIETAAAVAAASSKANNKAAEREQRGSRRGSFIHLLCDFPRTFFPFCKTPFSREAKGRPDHNFPTQATRIQEKEKMEEILTGKARFSLQKNEEKDQKNYAQTFRRLC
jgi:hypothetical protein